MSNTRSRWFFLIAALALIITLTGARLPALIAAPTPTPTAYPLPLKTVEVWDSPPMMVLTADPFSNPSANPRTLIAETTHFRFYVESSDFTAGTIPDLADRAETVYADVVARLSGFTAKAGLAAPLTVIIRRPEGPLDSGCGVRGVAMQGDDPQVIIYADSTVSEAYFWGVLAHETAHMIHAESLPGFGNHQPLTEGLATWGAADYWAVWMQADSLDDLVRGYLDSGDYLPLYDHYEMTLAYEDPNCIRYRDILYSEWASFTGYLITEYGFGRFGALMESAPAKPHLGDGVGHLIEIRPADFEKIYSLALNQLEARWLDWLRAGDV